MNEDDYLLDRNMLLVILTLKSTNKTLSTGNKISSSPKQQANKLPSLLNIQDLQGDRIHFSEWIQKTKALINEKKFWDLMKDCEAIIDLVTKQITKVKRMC